MKLKPLTSAEQLFVLASMTRPAQVRTGHELGLIHRNQGYSRIAVHFVIERDGAVFEGRPLNLPGALAGKRNTSAYQVCLLGGVNDAMEPEDNSPRPNTRRSLDSQRASHSPSSTRPPSRIRRTRMSTLSRQSRLVLDHLRGNQHLTSWQAEGVYRIRRLASRVDELRAAGYEVTTSRAKDATGQPTRATP